MKPAMTEKAIALSYEERELIAVFVIQNWNGKDDKRAELMRDLFNKVMA